MNPPKYTAIEYINFLIATQKAYSCTEAFCGFNRPRGLRRTMPSTACCIDLNPLSRELWQEAKADVELEQGMLVVDDTMLDKWYAKQMELVVLKQNRRVKEGIIIVSHSFHVKVTHNERDFSPSNASVL